MLPHTVPNPTAVQVVTTALALIRPPQDIIHRAVRICHLNIHRPLFPQATPGILILSVTYQRGVIELHTPHTIPHQRTEKLIRQAQHGIRMARSSAAARPDTSS